MAVVHRHCASITFSVLEQPEIECTEGTASSGEILAVGTLAEHQDSVPDGCSGTIACGFAFHACARGGTVAFVREILTDCRDERTRGIVLHAFDFTQQNRIKLCSSVQAGIPVEGVHGFFVAG